LTKLPQQVLQQQQNSTACHIVSTTVTESTATSSVSSNSFFSRSVLQDTTVKTATTAKLKKFFHLNLI
jgi:hypothetical protein